MIANATIADEGPSLRLQMLSLAIFDAILVHMLNRLSPDGRWLKLKKQILDALRDRQDPRIAKILNGPYEGTHILFLQQVRAASASVTLPAALPHYAIFAPAKPSAAGGNSVIALHRSRFDIQSAVDVTSRAIDLLPKSSSGAMMPMACDLLVVSARDLSGRSYLLASFHGGMDGRATAPALHAVHSLSRTMPQHSLIFGLDANTHSKPEARIRRRRPTSSPTLPRAASRRRAAQTLPSRRPSPRAPSYSRSSPSRAKRRIRRGRARASQRTFCSSRPRRSRSPTTARRTRRGASSSARWCCPHSSGRAATASCTRSLCRSPSYGNEMCKYVVDGGVA